MPAEASPLGVQVESGAGIDAEVADPQSSRFEAWNGRAPRVGLRVVMAQRVDDDALGWPPEAAAEFFLFFGQVVPVFGLFVHGVDPR